MPRLGKIVDWAPVDFTNEFCVTLDQTKSEKSDQIKKIENLKNSMKFQNNICYKHYFSMKIHISN